MKQIRDCLIRTGDIESLIASELRELQRLRSLSCNITADFSHERVAGNSGVDDRMAQCAAAIVDLEHEIQAETARLLDAKRSMRQLVASICNPRRRMLMRMRYLENMTWEQIAQCMDISPRAVYLLHNRILNDLDRPPH